MEQFTAWVADAYEHLYDIVHLRTHPLARQLLPDPELSSKDRAWGLHRLLLEVIEELDPGSHAPTFSREWRRHKLMVLRFVDGLDSQSVADEIGIGRRHYYREQQAAIEAIAQLLWERRSEAPPQELDGEAPLSRLELMRIEAARLVRTSRSPGLPDLLTGVLSLLRDRMRAHRLEPDIRLPEGLPQPGVTPNLLRQLLLATLSFLLERSREATICITATVQARQVHIALGIDPPEQALTSPAVDTDGRLSELAELGSLSGTRLVPQRLGERVTGIELWLPVGRARRVLVVDDNDDVVELYRRYLASHDYEVIGASTARGALDLARRLHPQAITLDLMMPDQDGWDILHSLLGEPATSGIPIIVCSVLRQRELALSLGAADFLEKPISEEALLSALQSLE